jgi:hypothetical protein
LLMEASGLSGAMLELVLVPGLLAAGVGSLVFTGLDAWTGLGTFSLAIPGLPHAGSPTGAEFLWALAIGVMAVPLGSGIRWLGLFLRPHIERRMLLATPVAGLAVAGLAIAFAAGTGKSSSEVLFSGQSALGPFLNSSASYTVGALLLLLVCKGIAYGVSLSSFRGGPTFPAMFLGAVGGVALSHLPGLPLVYGVAMGIGAMTVVMLRLPLTSVLLATLLLSSDGLQVMPLAIVAVVVAYVVSARFTPSPAPAAAADQRPAGEAAPVVPVSPQTDPRRHELAGPGECARLAGPWRSRSISPLLDDEAARDRSLRSALPIRVGTSCLAYERSPSMSTFPPIADYGFLSNCEQSCLVAPDGSVEWLCLPRPDAPSVFGALLDRTAGSFRFGPSTQSAAATLTGSSSCRSCTASAGNAT